MGKIGLGKKAVSISATPQMLAAFDTRCGALGISRSAYLFAIAAKWMEAGCPPVTEADRAVQHLRELEKSLPAKATGKGAAEARKAS